MSASAPSLLAGCASFIPALLTFSPSRAPFHDALVSPLIGHVRVRFEDKPADDISPEGKRSEEYQGQQREESYRKWTDLEIVRQTGTDPRDFSLTCVLVDRFSIIQRAEMFGSWRALNIVPHAAGRPPLIQAKVQNKIPQDKAGPGKDAEDKDNPDDGCRNVQPVCETSAYPQPESICCIEIQVTDSLFRAALSSQALRHRG